MGKILTTVILVLCFTCSNVIKIHATEINQNPTENTSFLEENRSVSYDYDTNPNSSQSSVFEIYAGQTKKIVGPWYGGFKASSPGFTYVDSWTVSWSGSHAGNTFRIVMCNGDTGEIIKTRYAKGSSGSVSFDGGGIASQGINFFVINDTSVTQAYWNFNVSNTLKPL